MKKVLILLSTYNGEEYLSEQLNSVFSQKGVEIHILMRDDGSTVKGCLEIANEYIEKGLPITVIKGLNIGFALSFSSLIEIAYKTLPAYDYYAFCDQDDVWLEDKVISAIAKLEELKSDKKIIPIAYCGRPTLVDRSLNLLQKRNSITPVNITKANSLVRGIATGCTMLFNHKALELYANHMPEKLYSHDLMMFQVCVFLGEVVFDSESHILYRQHGNNQIGLPNFWGRMKNRLCSPKHKGVLCSQSCTLLHLYKNMLSLEDIHLISKLAYYKDSWITKMNLLFDRKIGYNTFEQNLFYRLKIILGWV